MPALRRPDARADPALFTEALVTAARVASFIDLAIARQLAEQAVQAARQLDDERLLSQSLGVLCGAYVFAGEPETGRPFGQESVERARRLGDDVLLALSLLGYLLTTTRPGPLYAEAIACTERSGDHHQLHLPPNAGEAALEAGDLPAARAHLGDEQLERAYAQGMTSASTRPSTWPSEGRAQRTYRRISRDAAASDCDAE